MSEAIFNDAISIQKRLPFLDPGDLSHLRRANPMGCPAFWRLASNHQETLDKRPEPWIYIVASLAEMTVSVLRGDRQTLKHDKKTSLGLLFATGGIQVKGRISNPLLSERRLAHLGGLRGQKRYQQYHRIMRMVKAKSPPPYRIDVVELAWAFLDEKSGRPERNIAREYYRYVQ